MKFPSFRKGKEKEDSKGLPTIEEPKDNDTKDTTKDARTTEEQQTSANNPPSKSSHDDKTRESTTPLTTPAKSPLTHPPATKIAEPQVPKPSSTHGNHHTNSARPSSTQHRRTNTATTIASTSTAGGAATSSTNKNNGQPKRPGLERRRTTAQTRYLDMLLSQDDIPKWHNFAASFFVWILLAGYLVFPATFRKWRNEEGDSVAEKAALGAVRNVPLLYVAAVACGIGVFGCIWLWLRHRSNYVWVVNRIFMPALMNSIAGLISTFVNVYSAQDGQYSATARATIIVTSACSVVTAALFLLYNCIMLALVRRKHNKETAAMEREKQAGGEAAILEDGVNMRMNGGERN